MKDPSFASFVYQYAALTAFGGGMGIAADATLTAMSENPMATMGMAISPMFSTALNALSIGASAVNGVASRDTYEFEKVIKIGAREFGGLGRAVTNAAESAGVLSKPRKGSKQLSGYGEGY